MCITNQSQTCLGTWTLRRLCAADGAWTATCEWYHITPRALALVVFSACVLLALIASAVRVRTNRLDSISVQCAWWKRWQLVGNVPYVAGPAWKSTCSIRRPLNIRWNGINTISPQKIKVNNPLKCKWITIEAIIHQNEPPNKHFTQQPPRGSQWRASISKPLE